MKRRRRYWYRIYIGECPVCGRDQGYRERVYGRRPKLRKHRIALLTDYATYDDCIR